MNEFLDISTIGYPEKKVQDQISDLRQIFVKKFESKKALIWKPHITLAVRVLIPKNKFEKIIEEIKAVCRKTKPIIIETKSLEFVIMRNSPFEHPYVAWIAVKPNEKLSNLNQMVNGNIYKGLKRPSLKSAKYNPHLTLAYRDLTLENFEKAKKYFTKHKYNYNFTFALDNVNLMHHKDKNSVEDLVLFQLSG